MVDRLVVDLHPNGQAQVAAWRDGDELPDPGPAFELVWPLDDDALADLQWYLEDYLAAPFGVYEQRGPQVQARLAAWGSQVFGALFASGPARDAYVGLRARAAGTRLVIRSSSPTLLGLPWELMRDPDRPTPLALDLAGMSRSLPTSRLADTAQVPGGRLRVLMAISRPLGARDVGYQMIARPLLRRLEAVRGEVDLVVLRPPTMEALAETLARAAADGEPFQVVHFDGHGILNGRRAPGPDTYAVSGPEGVLVFEKPDGGADHVPASRIAQVLKAAEVPVVVLNACQSGAIGKELEAAVATRLLAEGTASVVAMAYTVYAVAASEFMAAFYERLFAGDPVSAAVTAGRQRMSASNGRPSPKGDMPLDDWLIPVHYLRRDVSFPQARTSRTGQLSLDAELDKIRRPVGNQGTGELDPVGSFTGRDGLFYELEVAARLQRVLVLYGPGGTGKTELAKAFGRWWRDTGGVEQPGLVFVHSFEPGVATFGLDGVVNEIGLRLFGADFALRETGERQAIVENVLAEHTMLLIWDNFETVRSMPDADGVTKPLDEDGSQEIKGFLARLAAGGRSAVLITSRSPEPWLGDVRRITVSGLTPREADEYAGYLLAPYPAAAPRRAKRAFGELMEWLDGHPLSMRLILPHLDTAEPGALLEALRGTAPLPAAAEVTGGRMTSLPASIAYSYAHLSESTRRLLPAVSLFQAVTDADLLAVFSQVSDVPDRFSGVRKDDWRQALDDASEVGLLTPLGSGMYRIHPALPAYLAAQWRQEEPAGHDGIREAATHALVAACADFGNWLDQQISSGDAGLAYAIIGLQDRTLGSMLSYALASGLWEEAQKIAQPLHFYLDARGLAQEADVWTDQILLATEDPSGTPPELDSPVGALWLFITGEDAARQHGRGQLDEAERIYDQIRSRLEAQSPSPEQKTRLAVAYHQLGIVAQGRGRLDDAEGWYRKSLAIGEELGDKPGTASTYHQLGIVAYDRGRLDDAEEWYRKSLAIKDELGNKPEIASTYHQLGMVAQRRGRLDDAEDWYRKSLAIKDELGNKPGMTLTYHQLGMVAYDRGRLDDAEHWSRKSLAIEEELGDKLRMASTYQLLGMVANRRGRLDDAEDWYRKSLAIKENLGNKPGMTLTFGQLGLLAEARENVDQALEWIVRCVTVFDEFPHPMTGPGPDHLTRLTAELGMAALEECWRKVTGDSLPRAVREYVESHRSSENG